MPDTATAQKAAQESEPCTLADLHIGVIGMREQHSFTQQVDFLRRATFEPFSLRGTCVRFCFDTSQPFVVKHGNGEIPVYDVHPHYMMLGTEWTSKLHATLYACVSRGVHHGRPELRAEIVDAGSLPAIMVFGPDPHLSSALAAKREKSYPFLNLEYSSRREAFEKALVHGKVRETFNESYLPGRYEGENFHSNLPCLFTVALSAEEHVGIVKALDGELRKFGIASLSDFKSSYFANPNSRDQLTALALKVSGRPKLDSTLETNYNTPADWLYGEQVAKLFVKCFLRQSFEYLRAQHSGDSSQSKRGPVSKDEPL